jgi:hypothetical protein
MTDLILVLVIVAFFAAAVLLVRALGGLVAEAAEPAEQEPDADYPVGARRHDLTPGRPE